MIQKKEPQTMRMWVIVLSLRISTHPEFPRVSKLTSSPVTLGVSSWAGLKLRLRLFSILVTIEDKGNRCWDLSLGQCVALDPEDIAVNKTCHSYHLGSGGG